jgi:hypothetical protein
MDTKQAERDYLNCWDCGAELKGRVDMKFCDNQCRGNYNNRIRRDARLAKKEAAKKEVAIKEEVKANAQKRAVKLELPPPALPEYVKAIQEIQLQNRYLMSQLCNEQRSSRVMLSHLIRAGFNPKCFTSEAAPTKEGKVYRFCFEYGFCDEKNGAVLLICRPSEGEYFAKYHRSKFPAR